MPEEKIGAAMGAEWALNNQTYMNGWFLSPEQVWLYGGWHSQRNR